MKKIVLILCCAAAMSLTSCSSLLGTSSNTNTASTTAVGATATPQQNGHACAQSLLALYNSKQTNGSVSITNPSDLTNIITLVNSCTQLKANKDDASYKSQFTAGMVSAGGSLINVNNASKIVTSIINSTGISTNFESVNISEKMQTITAIIQILNLLRAN